MKPSRLLVLLPPLAGCSSIEPREEIAARVALVSEERLRTELDALVAFGTRSTLEAEKIAAVALHLRDRLAGFGYEPAEEPFEARLPVLSRKIDEDGERIVVLSGSVPSRRVNVIAEIRGRTTPEEVVEVCAHYDTVPFSPGADDNGSGVVALLEIARLVHGLPVERTVRFCLFDGEEHGLLGSRAHVAGLAHRPEERHAGLFNLEMVGRANEEARSRLPFTWVPILGPPRRGDFLLVIGNLRSAALGRLFEAAADAYAPELRYYSANYLGGSFADAHRSDHVPYWEVGLEAVQLSDTGEFRSEHYHQLTDVPATLDFPILTAVTRATLAAVLHRAGLEPDSRRPLADGVDAPRR